MSEPYLSIVIPAYNEAERILPTLEIMKTFSDQQAYAVEVIVVDDASTDKTNEIVAGFIAGRKNFSLLTNPKNIGKGASLKKGMGLARGTYRLFSDADLSTPLDEIPKFLTELETYDVVIGSRRVPGANIVKRQPFYREMSGRIFSVLVRLIVLQGFLDTQCGFKMFTAETACAIFPKLTIMGFGFDVEALFIAKKVLGLRIKEAPVQWADSPKSQVRLWRDSRKMFVDLFRIRWNGLRGRYEASASAMV